MSLKKKFQFLKQLHNRSRVKITKSGWSLIGVTLLTGSAAFQSANNVLLLAMAFLMSIVVINGIISWINFTKLDFEFHHYGHASKGTSTYFETIVSNNKRFIPSAALKLSFGEPNLDVTINRNVDHVPENNRIRVRTEWVPNERGLKALSLHECNSLFPFGFIIKTYPLALEKSVLVWPNLSEKTFSLVDTKSAQSTPTLAESTRPGSSELGSELQNYQPGDSKKQVHWKKTAQIGTPISKRRESPNSQGVRIQFNLQQSHFRREPDFDIFIDRIASSLKKTMETEEQILVAFHNLAPVKIWDQRSLERCYSKLALINPAESSLQKRSGFWLISHSHEGGGP